MLNRSAVIGSLKEFKSRRDDALHEDDAGFRHHLQRLVAFLDSDSLAAEAMRDHFGDPPANTESFWEQLGGGEIALPTERGEELAIRLQLVREVVEDPKRLYAIRGKDHGDRVNFFRSVVMRPLLDALTDRMGEVAKIPSPEARALQAVPLDRIPSPAEVRIFLSHKTADKPLVYRFYHALTELGFAPWMDERDMPVGTNLERGLLRGFQESCAAVFFITKDFKDESYLATEVDYAIQQKRAKGDRFAIITLRFEGAAAVPGLLTPYVYQNVSNDLDGFRELVRALPIELGPLRWREGVVKG